MTYYPEDYGLPYEDTTDERSRKERWMAKGRARVSHPLYKPVIVPHASAYAAILNAAEYWGVDAYDLMRSGVCKVEATPRGAGKVVVPKEFREEIRK